MTSHPFYAVCKSISDKEITPRDYISKEFNSFFDNFYGFIHKFQMQVKTKLFQKDPAKVLKLVMEITDEILKESKPSDFHNISPDDVEMCFEGLLHPLNNNEIRTYGITLFISLVNALGKSAFVKVKNFLPLLIDYSPFEESPNDPIYPVVNIDKDLRIQVNDGVPPTRANILQHIEMIKTAACTEDSDFITWWRIIKTTILEPLYTKSEEENAIKIRKCPKEIHCIIRNFLTSVMKNKDRIYALVQELKAPPFIFSIVDDSIDYYLDDPGDFNMITIFFKLFADPSSNITQFLKIKYPSLLLNEIDMLLNMFTTSFSQRVFPKTLKDATFLFQATLMELVQNFDRETKKEAFRKISTWEKSYTRGGVSHVCFATLETLVLLKTEDKEIWKIFVDRSLIDNRILFTISIFFGYLGYIYSPQILDISDQKLRTAWKDLCATMNFLRRDYSLLENMLTYNPETYEQMFIKNMKNFTYNEVYKHKIDEKMAIRKITPQFSVETFLRLTKTIRGLYQEHNKSTMYLSFIKVFITIYKILPYTCSFNRSFIFSEFLDWLRKALTNDEEIIKLRALEALDDILSLNYAGEYVPDKALAEIYNNIRNMLTSSNKNIATTATNFFIHAMNNGLRYASNYAVSTLMNIEITPTIQAKDQCAFLSGCRLSILYGKEKSVDANKKFSFLCQSTENSLRVQLLMTLLIEECIFSRKEHISTIVKMIIDALIYRNNFDAISFSQISLIFPLLIKCDPEEADYIIKQIIMITRQKGCDPNAYITFIKLLVDLIIITSQTNNVEPYINSFIENTKRWHDEEINLQEEDIEKLEIEKKLLTFYVNRLPLQSFTPPMRDEQPISFWKDDSIIDATPINITSNSAIGRFKWEFKPVVTELYISKHISEIKKTEEKEDFGDQTLKNDLTSRIDKLFNESLPELGAIYKLDAPPEIPKDYPIIDERKITNEDTSEVVLPTKSVVPNTASQFLTTFSFYEFGENEGMIPRNENAIITPKKFNFSEYQTFHNVMLYSLQNKQHFSEFISGLGLRDKTSTKKNIFFNTIRHKIIFHIADNLNTETCPIQIVWTEGMTETEINSVLDSNALISIRINLLESLLYKVNIEMSKRIDINENYQNCYVCTKESLPIQILSNILFFTKIVAYSTKMEMDSFLLANKVLKDEHQSSFVGTEGRFISTLETLKIQ